MILKNDNVQIIAVSVIDSTLTVSHVSIYKIMHLFKKNEENFTPK